MKGKKFRITADAAAVIAATAIITALTVWSETGGYDVQKNTEEEYVSGEELPADERNTPGGDAESAVPGGTEAGAGEEPDAGEEPGGYDNPGGAAPGETDAGTPGEERTLPQEAETIQ